MSDESYFEAVEECLSAILRVRRLERELKPEDREVLLTVYKGIRDDYIEDLRGRPEEAYLKSLISQEASSQLRDLSVKDLGFSRYRCLGYSNVNTVSDLLRISENGLLRLPNISVKSVEEIRQLLEERGLRIGMEM